MTTSQVAPPPVAPVRVRRGPRRLLRALLGFLVFVLGLGLSFSSNPYAAQAYASPPLPVKIATTLASPGARLLAVGVATGPIGAALTAASLGLLAYQTRDSWWPVLDGVINGPGEETDTGTGSTTSTACVSPNGSHGRGVTISTEGTAQIDIQWECVRPDYAGFVPAIQVRLSGARCVRPDGSTYFRDGVVASWNNPDASNGTFSYKLREKTSGSYKVGLQACLDRSDELVAVTALAEQGMYVGFDAVTVMAPFDGASTVQTTEVTCRLPDGTFQTISDTLTGYPDRVAMPSCAARFPGSVPWSGSIKAGPSADSQREVQSFTTDQDVFDEWADCFGPSGLQCVIRVWVDGQPCSIGVDACEAWNKIHVDEPSRVQCKFGPHVVGIAECNPLKRSYRADTDVQTVTKVQPDGSPAFDGDPVVDPEPPEDPRMPPPDPNPEVPPSDVDPENPDGSKQENCNASEVSWNPISWVVVPLKCVFIPSEGIGSRADRLKDRYKGRAPFAFLTPVVGMAYGVGSECPEWRIKVPAPGGGYAVDSNVVCESSFTQAIRNARPFLVAGGIALAFWPLVRGVLYASVPIVKPTPTDGK